MFLSNLFIFRKNKDFLSFYLKYCRWILAGFIITDCAKMIHCFRLDLKTVFHLHAQCRLASRWCCRRAVSGALAARWTFCGCCAWGRSRPALLLGLAQVNEIGAADFPPPDYCRQDFDARHCTTRRQPSADRFWITVHFGHFRYLESTPRRLPARPAQRLWVWQNVRWLAAVGELSNWHCCCLAID